MKASEIREILKLTQKPEYISFAGGLPNPQSFPTEAVKEIVSDLLDKDSERVMQYGTTEGYEPLRSEVGKWAREMGMMDIHRGNIMITHGSQQALDIISKVFINRGDPVIVGAPTYLGALSVWKVTGAHFEEVEVDATGLDMDSLDETISRLKHADIHPKIIYVVPNFQNPAGVTMSEKRRKQVVDIANEHDCLVLEDDPYGQIRFKGTPIKPVKAFDDTGRVIYMSTFSKLLAPGFRVAWMAADARMTKKFVKCKQYTDLCTNSFGQAITYEYIARGHMKSHIPKIISLYERKCGLLMKALDEKMPDDFSWTRPEGGMFSWMTLPKDFNSVDLLKTSLKHKVAFVTGTAFYANPLNGVNKARLNFTHPADERIPEGVDRLVDSIAEYRRGLNKE